MDQLSFSVSIVKWFLSELIDEESIPKLDLQQWGQYQEDVDDDEVMTNGKHNLIIFL